MASNNPNQNMNNSSSLKEKKEAKQKENKVMAVETTEEAKPSSPPVVPPRPTTARGSRTQPQAGVHSTQHPESGEPALPCFSNNTVDVNHGNYASAESTNAGNGSRFSGYDDQPPSTSSKGKSSSSAVQRQRTFSQHVSREEISIGEQTRFLLNYFIQDRAGVEHSPVEPVVRDVCQADTNAESAGFTDESLGDIALTLRRIGDDMSRDVQLNRFIDQVPIQSTKEIFMKVCLQMFQDGNFNWGRIVALFYFAYRLIVRSLLSGLDTMPWIQELISWVVDFIVQKFAKWIISRGGWKMINEWFGISTQTWCMLACVSAIILGWAILKKD